MTEREPKGKKSLRKKFNNLIERQPGITSTEFYIGKAVEFAMDIREHPAAYKTPHGVGMLTPYRHTYGFSVSVLGIAAAVVTNDGKIVVEHHKAHGVTPERIDSSECEAYQLDPQAENLTVIGNFTKGTDPWYHAYNFHKIIWKVIGKGPVAGVTHVPFEGRDIVNELLFKHDHKITSPLIEELMSVAFQEEA